MKKVVTKTILSGIMMMLIAGCNNSVSSSYKGEKKESIDRSQRTVIDAEEYIDFTIKRYDATTFKKNDILQALGGKKYKNEESTISLNMLQGTIELVTKKGTINNKYDCEVYAKYSIEVMAASDDCLYIRRDVSKEGILIIDNETFNNDQIPDISVCIPLYGYSRNRIEVSSIMNGYILMPSGTYWLAQ